MDNSQIIKKRLLSEIPQADEKLLVILDSVMEAYNRPINEKYSVKELYRLVYTSARKSKCTEADIDQILKASQKNNAQRGVTGILIHTKDRFLQVLEGEKDEVMNLYKKIEKDDRHGGSVMRFCEPVSERHFPDWDMAGKKVDSGIEYNTSISAGKMKLYRSMMDGDLSSYKDEGMRVLKTFLLVS
jgi:hypothetical protein